MSPIRENPVGLTADAATNLQRLNQATQGPGGYWGPWEAHQTLGNLQVLAARLDKALDQAREWLTAEHEHGRIADDRPGVPADTTVDRVRTLLVEAARAAHDLARLLEYVTAATTHLTTPPREDSDG